VNENEAAYELLEERFREGFAETAPDGACLSFERLYDEHQLRATQCYIFKGEMYGVGLRVDLEHAFDDGRDVTVSALGAEAGYRCSLLAGHLCFGIPIQSLGETDAPVVVRTRDWDPSYPTQPTWFLRPTSGRSREQ